MFHLSLSEVGALSLLLPYFSDTSMDLRTSNMVQETKGQNKYSQPMPQ